MQRIARALLRATGWRVDGDAPALRRYVLVAAPHTSNWDLLWLLLMAWSADVPITWLGKHTLFVGPVGWFLRRLGGVPVTRHRSEDRVAATARLFAERAAVDAPLVLVIPPEGTRGRAGHWRSGFFHIARSAGVPVVPTALDYARRRGEFGEPIVAGDDVGAFMDTMRAFYADRGARRPERFGPIRLLEEAGDERDAA